MSFKVAPLKNLPQTAEHRRSFREEMNAFFLRDLVSQWGTNPHLFV